MSDMEARAAEVAAAGAACASCVREGSESLSDLVGTCMFSVEERVSATVSRLNTVSKKVELLQSTGWLSAMQAKLQQVVYKV